MKTFVCLISIALAISFVAASSSSTSSSSSVVSNTNQDAEGEAQPANTAQPNNDYNRFRKAAYGGGGASGGYGAASIPAPPCPKNYLFSCQPNLAPVPCAAPAASYGSSGAYSAPVPTYVSPLGNNYGIPQTYGNFAPQPYSQFYSY